MTCWVSVRSALIRASPGKITQRPCLRSSAGSETMRSPTHAPGRRSTRPIRPSGRTTMWSTITPIGSARTGDTARKRCYVECWGAPSPKRCCRGLCTRLSSPARLLNLGTSSSSTGNSLERMGYPPEKKSRCGCMRIRVIRRVPGDYAVPVLNPLGRGAATDHRGQKRASHRDPFSQPTAGSLALI